jgi:hypothetical protein
MLSRGRMLDFQLEKAGLRLWIKHLLGLTLLLELTWSWRRFSLFRFRLMDRDSVVPDYVILLELGLLGLTAEVGYMPDFERDEE